MVLPIALWCSLLGENSTSITCVAANTSSTATGIGVLATLSNGHGNIFYLSSWISSFFSASLATNFVSAGLLALRIWHLYRETSRYPNATSNNPMCYRVFRVLLDSGALYSMTLLIALILYLLHSNAQFIMVDVVSLFTSLSVPSFLLPPDLLKCLNGS